MTRKLIILNFPCLGLMQITMFIFLFISSFLAVSGAFSYELPPYCEMTSIQNDKITLICNFPAPEIGDFTDPEGQVFSVVSISGLVPSGEAGGPEVPALIIPICVPEGQQVEFQFRGTMEKQHLPYTPRPRISVMKESDDNVPVLKERYVIDKEHYSQNRYIPAENISIEEAGYFRRTRLSSLRINPLSINPLTKEFSCYSHLEITLLFSDKIADGKKDHPMTGYFQEKDITLAFLRNLLLNPDFVIKGKTIEGRLNRNAFEKNSPESRSGEWFRVTISEKGMHRITYTELSSAGMNMMTTNPRKIAMYKDGSEIDIVVSGENDGIFNPQDSIIFYGTVPGNDYSDSNVYWLTVQSNNGSRMANVNGAPSGSEPLLTTFRHEEILETNAVYWSNIPDAENKDHWFWEKLIAPTTGTYQFNANDPGPTPDVTISSFFRGFTYNDNVNPDHHVRVLLNDTTIDDVTWDGQSEFDSEVDPADGLLQSGLNTLKVVLDGDTGSSVDAIFHNKFEISYKRMLNAVSNHLAYSIDQTGITRARITNFSSSAINAFNVSDPLHVTRIMNAAITQDGSTFRVEIAQNQTIPQFYEILAENAYCSIDSMEMDTLSNLKSPNLQSDFLIIAPVSFHAALEPLKRHREQQGFSTMVISIQDVYDEFSDGLFNPEAIKSFLEYAFENWQNPVPVAVLLMGEANFDYHNYYGTTIENIVPTSLIETILMGQTISDHPFATISGPDIIPDIFIGRSTVRDITDVENFVLRTIRYESLPEHENWMNNILLVSDSDLTHETALNALKTEHFDPGGFTSSTVYLRDYGSNVEQATSDIVSSVTNGCFLTLYLGHGGMETWSNEMLEVEDINSFANWYHQPLLIASSCLNGYFGHHQVASCMSEEWMRYKVKGAICTSASTSLTSVYDINKFHERVCQELFTFQHRNAGIAIWQAEIYAYLVDNASSEHIRTQSFLGDPLTVFRQYSSERQSIVVFDRPYYRTTADSAVLTLWDPEANSNQSIPNVVSVTVRSRSDETGFTMSLVETGPNSGIFSSASAGSSHLYFSEEASSPSAFTLLVRNNDWIEVSYYQSFTTLTHTNRSVYYDYSVPELRLFGLVSLLIIMSLFLFRKKMNRRILQR